MRGATVAGNNGSQDLSLSPPRFHLICDGGSFGNEIKMTGGKRGEGERGRCDLLRSGSHLKAHNGDSREWTWAALTEYSVLLPLSSPSGEQERLYLPTKAMTKTSMEFIWLRHFSAVI